MSIFVVLLLEKKLTVTCGTSYLAKIFVQLIEMQLEPTGLTEIFQNKQKIFRGTPRFPFEPIGMEIAVPLIWHKISIFHLVCAIM